MFNRTLFVVSLTLALHVSIASGQKLYWTDFVADKIQRADPDGANIEDLVATGANPTGIAIDHVNGKMYWVESGSHRIQRADLDGSNIELLGFVSSPWGIAVDPGGGKMYWTESSGKGQIIWRADLDGSNIEPLVHFTVEALEGIALDTNGGKMYWVNPGSGKIQRADLDGANVEDLVTSGLITPLDLALDLIERKMYWTDWGTHKIQRADVCGTNVEDLVTTGLDGPIGIALDLAAGKMYWADLFLDKIQRANLDGSNVEDVVTTGTVDPYGIALDLPPEDGIPEICPCPQSSQAVAETIGADVNLRNRFLTFNAGDADVRQAVRITFLSLPPPFDVWDGAELWVGPTRQVSEAGANPVPSPDFPNFTAATLQCTPSFDIWSVRGTVHVFHEGIVPGGIYRVEVISKDCYETQPENYSPLLDMTTAIWGDTVFNLAELPALPAEGDVNVVDAIAVLGRFASVPTSIGKSRADLEPGCLDLTINVADVLASLGGFVGVDYPFTPTAANPCDSTCANVLP